MRGVTRVRICQASRLAISTHTPHARRDPSSWLHLPIPSISTHTPHARRDNLEPYSSVAIAISTHTPHARRDGQVTDFTPSAKFLLTRLMRGVTTSSITVSGSVKISTHTPHARRDSAKFLPISSRNISTHTPHARRDNASDGNAVVSQHFYSHASCEA